ELWVVGPADRAPRDRPWPSLGEARDVFQQRDDSGVNEASAPLYPEGTEQLLDHRGRGQRHAEGARRLHDEPQILEVQVDLEAGIVRVGEVVRLLLIEALRAGEAAGQRGQRQVAGEAPPLCAGPRPPRVRRG